MRGAVAAGHRLTAEAGARVLAAGGNAVDACIAAGFASWVCESPLTGPGAGGFMLVRSARDGTTRLLDFYVAMPGLGREGRSHAEMEAIDVQFDRGGAVQVFHVGGASCAVPGAPAGLEAAHRAFGTLPWRELIAPAVELARAGVELTPGQAYLHAILDLILRHTEDSRAIYGEEARLVAGDRLTMSDLANTLERLADNGARDLYQGELADAVVRCVRKHGGTITNQDLADYRVIRRRPLSVSFLGHEFVSNPPPASGGVLIALGVRLLDRLGLGGGPGSAGAIVRLVEVMREQTRARTGSFVRDLYRGGLTRRLCSDEAVAAAVERIRAHEPGVAGVPAARGTTHISVVDGDGNAASLSASTGAGSGVVVPGTGIHLNNMLGEYEVTGAATPGARLTSLMAPSLVLRDGQPRLVVGSAGSLRLHGAIMQIVANVVGHGLGVEEAIERPRVHLEEPHVHCEGGHDADELDRIAERGYDVVRWRRRNLYFGGASGVELRGDGTLAAAGDPRRGGDGIVVE